MGNDKIEQILKQFEEKFFQKLYKEGSTTDFDWYLQDEFTNLDDELQHMSIDDIRWDMKSFIRIALQDIIESKNIEGKAITKKQIKELLEKAYNLGWESSTFMKVNNLNKKRKDIAVLQGELEINSTLSSGEGK